MTVQLRTVSFGRNIINKLQDWKRLHPLLKRRISNVTELLLKLTCHRESVYSNGEILTAAIWVSLNGTFGVPHFAYFLISVFHFILQIIINCFKA